MEQKAPPETEQPQEPRGGISAKLPGGSGLPSAMLATQPPSQDMLFGQSWFSGSIFTA